MISATQIIFKTTIQHLFASRFVEESNFVNEDEPCYRGVLRGGQFKLPGGTGLATVAFRLTVSNTHAIEVSI